MKLEIKQPNEQPLYVEDVNGKIAITVGDKSVLIDDNIAYTICGFIQTLVEINGRNPATK